MVLMQLFLASPGGGEGGGEETHGIHMELLTTGSQTLCTRCILLHIYSIK